MTYDAAMNFLRSHTSPFDLSALSQKIEVDESLLRQALMQEKDAQGNLIVVPPAKIPHLLRIIELMHKTESDS